MILQSRLGIEQSGMRLDDGLQSLFPELSKGRIRKIIEWGGCSVGQAMVRVASRTVREGEEVSLGIMEPERYLDFRLAPADILYEDADYVAVNKGAGINSQRTPYQLKGTLEHAVSFYFREQGNREPVRVVHRLDRGTSGVMIFPKTKRAATHISYLFKEGKVEKLYWAIAGDRPDVDEWTLDAPIIKLNKFRYGVALPGKPAKTLFRVLVQGESAVLVEARPQTGRTHQIRVHLAHCKMPIIGDAAYGGLAAQRMMLHSHAISFKAEGGRLIQAVAPVDKAFAEICNSYGIALPLNP
ncbi:MAG: RluA family pseudouridine synthase [Geobacteraceae bacterium]